MLIQKYVYPFSSLIAQILRMADIRCLEGWVFCLKATIITNNNTKSQTPSGYLAEIHHPDRKIPGHDSHLLSTIISSVVPPNYLKKKPGLIALHKGLFYIQEILTDRSTMTPVGHDGS